MADEAASGGGGGGPGYLAIYDYEALRAAVMADSPDAVNRLVLLWRKLSEIMENLGTDLGRAVEATRTVYAAPESAPVFFDSLLRLQGRIHDLAVDLHRNALAMDQADLALRAAQREMAELHGDGTTTLVDLRTGKDVRAEAAGRIAYQLNDAYGSTLQQLGLPGRGNQGNYRPPDFGPGDQQPLGTPAVAYVTAPPPGQTIGGPVRPSGSGGDRANSPVKRGPSSTTTPPTASGGTPPEGKRGVIGGFGGSGTYRKPSAPGSRNGVVGGSRIPVARGGLLGSPGSSGAGSTFTQPGAPGSGGPNHVAPPGSGPGGGTGSNVPPGGMPGQGGGPRDGRGGRRLSWYEKIEDEFVDQRFASPPGGTIGGDRVPPGTVEPGPNVIGPQKQPSTAASHQDWEMVDRSPVQQNHSDSVTDGSQQDGATFQIRRRSGGA